MSSPPVRPRPSKTTTRCGRLRSCRKTSPRWTADAPAVPARRSSTRSRRSRTSVSATVRSRASSIEKMVAPYSRATRSSSRASRSGSTRAMTPTESGRGEAAHITRPDSQMDWPSRRSRCSNCSRWAGGSFDTLGGSLNPAHARRLPKRSSRITGSPVTSCTALAIPSIPSPETAARVRRSWISIRWARACTVDSSRELTDASCSAAVRSSWWSRLLRSAVPICCARTRSRKRPSLLTSWSAATTMCPRDVEMPPSEYAQAHVEPGMSTAPPSVGRSRMAGGAVLLSSPGVQTVVCPSCVKTPTRRQAANDGAALAPSRMICCSSVLSVMSIDRTSRALSRES